MSRAALVALAAGAILAAALIVHPASGTGAPLRDFEAYDAAGAAWHAADDPYGRNIWSAEAALSGVSAARDELLPFVGPPFGLPLWSALSQLRWRTATRVWEAVLALAAAVLIFGSLKLAGGPIRPLDFVAVSIVAAGFGPLTSALALGQVALIAVAAIVVTAFALQRGRVGAAVAAALVAALQPNLAVVLVVLLGTASTWIALAGAATFVVAGSALAGGGLASLARYALIVRAQGVAERFTAIQTTPAAVARALGAPAHAAGVIALGCALAVTCGLAAACASRRYMPIDRLTLACAALPLALPFAHEHDLTLAFLPAIAGTRRTRGLLWTLIATSALLAGTDWLGLAQHPAAASQTLLLTLAAALSLAALARGPLQLHHALPSLVTFAVLGMSFVAARHPLPIWPDALDPRFHAAPALTAAGVWHLEQLRSGIARLDPVWGALRLLSLGGCLLLWIGLSVALRRPSATSLQTPRSEPFSTAPRRPAEACPSR